MRCGAVSNPVQLLQYAMAVVDDCSPAPDYVDEELDKEVEKRAVTSAAAKKQVRIYKVIMVHLLCRCMTKLQLSEQIVRIKLIDYNCLIFYCTVLTFVNLYIIGISNCYRYY